jgi:hypothetical protein
VTEEMSGGLRHQRESNKPHPLSDKQLEAAGTIDIVKGAGIHRDGYAMSQG